MPCDHHQEALARGCIGTVIIHVSARVPRESASQAPSLHDIVDVYRSVGHESARPRLLVRHRRHPGSRRFFAAVRRRKRRRRAPAAVAAGTTTRSMCQAQESSRRPYKVCHEHFGVEGLPSPPRSRRTRPARALFAPRAGTSLARAILTRAVTTSTSVHAQGAGSRSHPLDSTVQRMVSAPSRPRR